jgi:hypothetical protein
VPAPAPAVSQPKPLPQTDPAAHGPPDSGSTAAVVSLTEQQALQSLEEQQRGEQISKRREQETEIVVQKIEEKPLIVSLITIEDPKSPAPQIQDSSLTSATLLAIKDPEPMNVLAVPVVVQMIVPIPTQDLPPTDLPPAAPVVVQTIVPIPTKDPEPTDLPLAAPVVVQTIVPIPTQDLAPMNVPIPAPVVVPTVVVPAPKKEATPLELFNAIPQLTPEIKNTLFEFFKMLYNENFLTLKSNEKEIKQKNKILRSQEPLRLFEYILQNKETLFHIKFIWNEKVMGKQVWANISKTLGKFVRLRLQTDKELFLRQFKGFAETYPVDSAAMSVILNQKENHDWSLFFRILCSLHRS